MIVTDRVTVTGRPQHYCKEGNLGEGKVRHFQILSVYILEIYQLVSFFRVIVIIRIGVNFRVLLFKQSWRRIGGEIMKKYWVFSDIIFWLKSELQAAKIADRLHKRRTLYFQAYSLQTECLLVGGANITNTNSN